MARKQSRKTFASRLDAMVNSLRNDILNGYYIPGEAIPSEVALAERYHISDRSVRKGLDKLAG